MSKKTKSLLYNFIAFAVIFFPVRYLLYLYAGLDSFWLSLAAFVVSTLLSPKFQAVTTNEGEKLYMKWPFVKGFKEIK